MSDNESAHAWNNYDHVDKLYLNYNADNEQ